MAGISRKRYEAGLEIDPGKNKWKFWKKGNVVYWDRFAIPGVDAKTFRKLNDVWARDARRVYCHSSAVRGADPKTFVVLNRLFAKDKARVYCNHGECKKCDAKTFEVLDKGNANSLPDMDDDHCGYARDKTNVYYHESGSGNARHLRGADRDSFRVLKYGFASDKLRVYAYGQRLDKVEPEFFQILNPFYSREANRVFYNAHEVAGADAATFRPLNEDHGRDAKRIYWRQWVEEK